MACTVHPPLSGWGNFEHDVWELFDLEHDRSQSTNLADQEPERLEKLKGLWFYNAGRYNGLPLDDRSALEQVLAERPRAAAPRDRYVFYPNCADVPESAGPALPGRSYTIAAGVKVDSPDVQGVLWAAGGVPGGHSLYVKDAACTTRSTGSAPRSRTSSPTVTSPSGAHVCTAEFAATGPSTNPDMPGTAGTLTLYVDDQAVGSGRDRHPARLLLPHRRRHLRRPRQRLGRLAELRRTVHRSPAARSTRSSSTSPATATSTTKPRSAPGSRSTDGSPISSATRATRRRARTSPSTASSVSILASVGRRDASGSSATRTNRRDHHPIGVMTVGGGAPYGDRAETSTPAVVPFDFTARQERPAAHVAVTRPAVATGDAAANRGQHE